MVRIAGSGFGCMVLMLGMITGSARPAPAGQAAVDALLAQGQAQIPLPTAPQALAVRWELTRLISEVGQEERYQVVADPTAAGVRIQGQSRSLAAGGMEIRLTLRSTAAQRLFLRGEMALAVPMADAQWWNGYDDLKRGEFDPHDGLLAKWFPLNAALDTAAGLGVGLGVNPREVYSRIDTGYLPARRGGGKELSLALPCVLDPGQDFEMVFVVTAFPARFGYRDAVQHYYDLFPEAYEPAEGIDPRVISAEVSYLAWNPGNYGLDALTSRDMIRRFTGGTGGWEWCYAPMVRGGDWATTEAVVDGWNNLVERGPRRGQWNPTRIERHRQNTVERLGRVEAAGSAPMYYVNVMYIETSLAEERYAGALFDRQDRPSIWGQPVTTSIYPGWNTYAADFLAALGRIPTEYPVARGIGYDSVFGHRILTTAVDGVEKTPRRSFNRGEIIAIEGAGHAALLDRSREQSAGNYRIANAVNLKLVSPYFLGARTDTALYEGAPMDRPERLKRIEIMRARLGTGKAIAWHKHLTPRHLRWIEWDRLEPEQMRAALRQVHDDNLLLSYFWGAVSAPMMPALGVERTFRAMPELIELTRLGWQPAPRMAVTGGGLPVRYGSGLGANLVLINPGYEARELSWQLDARDWDGFIPLLARHDGQELESALVIQADGGQVRGTLQVPAKAVARLVVIGRARPAAGVHTPVSLKTSGQRDARGRVGWALNLSGELAVPAWEVELLAWPEAVASEVTLAGRKQVFEPGQPIALQWDTQQWSIDFQSSNESVRWARVYLDHEPAIREKLSAAELAALNLPALLQEQKLVLVASEAGQPAAEVLADWFAAFSVLAGGEAQRPSIQTAAAPGQVAITVEVGAAPPHGSLAEIRPAAGGLVLQAGDAASLGQAVDRLLLRLDAAYPQFGVLPEKGDPYLDAMGLSGQVLFSSEQPPVHVAGPTLETLLQRAGLLP